MMHIAAYTFLAAWGAACWRARGGGAADATGFRFWGTSATRAIFGLALILPLLLVTWRAIVLWPVFWAAWSVTGWGAYQDMGGDYNFEWPVNPVSGALGNLGPLAHDLAGMAIEGLICMALPALAVAGLLAWQAWPDVAWHAVLLRAGLLWLSGVAFSPLVLAGDRIRLPALGRFCSGQEWREALVGAWVLPVVAWALAG